MEFDEVARQAFEQSQLVLRAEPNRRLAGGEEQDRAVVCPVEDGLQEVAGISLGLRRCERASSGRHAGVRLLAAADEGGQRLDGLAQSMIVARSAILRIGRVEAEQVPGVFDDTLQDQGDRDGLLSPGRGASIYVEDPFQRGHGGAAPFGRRDVDPGRVPTQPRHLEPEVAET